MGKGVIPDDHKQSIAPGRSLAIGNVKSLSCISCRAYISVCVSFLKADVIVLLGARLNWQMHYGVPPSKLLV